MSFTIKTLSADTRLSSLNFDHLDVILAERFLLPPVALKKIGEALPETLADVSRLSGMSLQEIQEVFAECSELSKDLYIKLDSLDAVSPTNNCLLIDMRPQVTIEDEPLHPHARMFHLESPQKMLPFLRTLDQVIVLSDKDDHAWSAALSLRKMGIKAFLPNS